MLSSAQLYHQKLASNKSISLPSICWLKNKQNNYWPTVQPSIRETKLGAGARKNSIQQQSQLVQKTDVYIFFLT